MQLSQFGGASCYLLLLMRKYEMLNFFFRSKIERVKRLVLTFCLIFRHAQNRTNIGPRIPHVFHTTLTTVTDRLTPWTSPPPLPGQKTPVITPFFPAVRGSVRVRSMGYSASFQEISRRVLSYTVAKEGGGYDLEGVCPGEG